MSLFPIEDAQVGELVTKFMKGEKPIVPLALALTVAMGQPVPLGLDGKPKRDELVRRGLHCLPASANGPSIRAHQGYCRIAALWTMHRAAAVLSLAFLHEISLFLAVRRLQLRCCPASSSTSPRSRRRSRNTTVSRLVEGSLNGRDLL